MSATALGSDDVAVYLERVRAALGDLPAEERDALLSDVEASLRDTAADSAASAEARLGPPEGFAAELRTAAGFAPVAPPAEAQEGLFTRIERRLRPLTSRSRDFAPLWWVARAYIAVALAATILGSSWYYRIPLIPMLHSGRRTELVFVLALVVSLVLGPLRPRWMRGFDLLLAVAIIPVAIQVAGNQGIASAGDSFSESGAVAAPAGLTYDDNPVQNIYAYDRRGRLLHDVRLFDNLGRPLNVGGSDPTRRRVRVTGGRAVLNAFPIRYYDPGTKRVAHPNAAPHATLTPLRTRPLPTRRPRSGR